MARTGNCTLRDGIASRATAGAVRWRGDGQRLDKVSRHRMRRLPGKARLERDHRAERSRWRRDRPPGPARAAAQMHTWGRRRFAAALAALTAAMGGAAMLDSAPRPNIVVFLSARRTGRGRGLAADACRGAAGRSGGARVGELPASRAAPAQRGARRTRGGGQPAGAGRGGRIAGGGPIRLGHGTLVRRGSRAVRVGADGDPVG